MAYSSNFSHILDPLIENNYQLFMIERLIMMGAKTFIRTFKEDDTDLSLTDDPKKNTKAWQIPVYTMNEERRWHFFHKRVNQIFYSTHHRATVQHINTKRWATLYIFWRERRWLICEFCKLWYKWLYGCVFFNTNLYIVYKQTKIWKMNGSFKGYLHFLLDPNCCRIWVLFTPFSPTELAP